MSVSAERPFSVGQVVWTPTEDAREHSLLARYTASVGRGGADFQELWQLVGLRPRGLLGVDLGLLRDPGGHAVRARARLAGDARRRMVPRRAPELRRAHARPRRGPRRASRSLARSQSRDPFDADLRRPARPGRAGARGTAAARRRPRRPGRRLPAEHPRDARRVPGHGEPRRDLGDCPPEFGPGACSTASASWSRAVLLAVDGYRWGESWIDRREQVAEVRAGLPSLRTVVHVPYGGDTSSRTRSRGTSSSPRRARSSSTPVPFDHPLYVLFSSGTTGLPEGDRPRPRRHPARAPEEPRPLAGTCSPGDRLHVVHDHRLDDVERARLGAAPARVDRDDRRQPGLPRPLRAVADGRGDAADDVRAQPGVHDGLPQGGPRARARLRPVDAAAGLRRRLAAARRRLRVDLRAGSGRR